jgi:hypothetical protein
MFRRQAEPGTPLSQLMSDGRDGLDAGQLVRALARSIVHVPMPGEAAEKQPRVVSTRDGELPPLYVIEDDEGRHALIYSTPRRLVESFGAGVTAASIPFATLLLAWPDATDVVIDAGHPDALVVPAPILHHVQLETAGIPTGTALEPAPGDHTSAPESELEQVIGSSRIVAERSPEVAAMWRAVTLPAGPAPRPVIDVLVDFDPVGDERISAVMTELAAAISDAEARPVRMLASVGGVAAQHPQLAEAIRAADAPYYRRQA